MARWGVFATVLRYRTYAAYKHPGTLHATLGKYIAYKICHLFLCAHALIFVYLDISGRFTNFHGICEALPLCSLKFANLTCFIIDYLANTDTPFLLFNCDQPSQYL